MKNTKLFASTLELVAILGFALILGACTSRSSGTLYSNSDTPLTCTVSVLQNPIPLWDTSGASPQVDIGISSSLPAQVMSITLTPSTTGISLASFPLPSQMGQQWSLKATPNNPQQGGIISVTVKNANATQGCSGSVAFATTAADAPNAANLRFNLPGDYNGDTAADTASWDATTGKWYVTLANSTIAKVWGNWGTAQNWMNVTAIDINNDNKKDIVGRDLNTGSWWAAVSSGTAFSNRFLGTFSTQTTWTNIQFTQNESGSGYYVSGTDGNGNQYKLNLNANGPSVLEPMAPAVQLGVSAAPVMFGQIPPAIVSVAYNGTAYVSWNAQTSCTLYTGSLQVPVPLPGAVGPQGMNYPIHNITASQTMIYAVCGSNPMTVMPASAMVTVASIPTPVLLLSAPDFALPGVQVPINWNATYVTPNSCTIQQNGNVLANLVGPTMQSAPIIADTTIILGCVGPQGPVSKTVQVKVAATLTVGPPLLNFGNVKKNTCSAEIPLRLDSLEGDLQVASVVIGGDIFALKPAAPTPGTAANPGKCGFPPFTLTKGSACLLPVYFCPIINGAQTSTLVIKYQAVNLPASLRDSPVINLSGTGKL